jgi:hypothetical protein
MIIQTAFSLEMKHYVAGQEGYSWKNNSSVWGLESIVAGMLLFSW